MTATVDPVTHEWQAIQVSEAGYGLIASGAKSIPSTTLGIKDGQGSVEGRPVNGGEGLKRSLEGQRHSLAILRPGTGE